MDEAHAIHLDEVDPLASFRDRFYQLADTIYLDGNSLGLLSRDSEACVLRVLAQWKEHAIGGYSLDEESWYHTGEELGSLMAPLVGAKENEVVATGTTIVNLHNLLATFYRPDETRRKLLATALDFPSDVYALQSHIRLHDGDIERDIMFVPSLDGRTIDENTIVESMTEEVAVAVLPSVLYRSGQLLDIGRLTREAHKRGIFALWDCSHSVGVVPHALHQDEVDGAVWCSYKYLNGGPGSVAALFVHRRRHERQPGLAGWWGSDKEQQFDMSHTFMPTGDVGAWQISSNPQLSAAALRGSLKLIREAGIERIREKSLAQTDYLMSLLRPLAEPPYEFVLGNPSEPERRGGHVALEHATEAERICKVLKRRHRIIPDFRPPRMIRLAPIPLYTQYQEIWRTVRALREIMEDRQYEEVEPGRELIA